MVSLKPSWIEVTISVFNHDEVVFSMAVPSTAASSATVHSSEPVTTAMTAAGGSLREEGQEVEVARM
jgi:hypothetical protein